MKRKKIKRKSRIRNLYKKQGGKCYLCGGQMSLRRADLPNFATIDHVIPVSRLRYSFEHGRNKRAACYSCNEAKGNMSLSEYLRKKDGDDNDGKKAGT